MCTAISYIAGGHYLGRTLDLEQSYGEEVTVIPRNFPFSFLREDLPRHYAIIGMAHVAQGVPLLYDGCNEMGLAMAGLHFPRSAHYSAEGTVAHYELMAWVLSQCATVAQARAMLRDCVIDSRPFSPQLPPAPLHWMLCDRSQCLVVESTAQGLALYDNPTRVLTNEPPFPIQLRNLEGYLHLSPQEPENRFDPELPLSPDSRGMGAMGLPGDLSSRSRFVRAAFFRGNSPRSGCELESVSQLFQILDTVTMPRGGSCLADGQWEFTRYASCCAAERGVYYYTSWKNRCVCAVDLHREDLEGRALVRYPLIQNQQIRMQN